MGEFECDGLDGDTWGEDELNKDDPSIVDRIKGTPDGGC